MSQNTAVTWQFQLSESSGGPILPHQMSYSFLKGRQRTTERSDDASPWAAVITCFLELPYLFSALNVTYDSSFTCHSQNRRRERKKYYVPHHTCS
ncbi:hypothetical protein EVAR_95504_1 [Eumeta japonica]|uniref:Uncharacterized protein n=1 Tax=Eumeta variegata TaxID=151549 RepID=A0A4C1UIM6_EUMVA|nr:hypothetical protein EVAR_95504_1 [Eumeta japonica]